MILLDLLGVRTLIAVLIGVSACDGGCFLYKADAFNGLALLELLSLLPTKCLLTTVNQNSEDELPEPVVYVDHRLRAIHETRALDRPVTNSKA
ncbi:hypothetical protein D3226_03120 [Leucobacter chromiireducens subsp. chromiireducens]|uniref:Secreted protein n=1 Tax=Leucobacter chromiireducens subsp. chromiireducens TaxID=660067 RepID=A0ABS1SLA1_9MICO|nr:hypothetical protein [Leucobacter chromiireducens subsp. chromiireducens]